MFFSKKKSKKDDRDKGAEDGNIAVPSPPPGPPPSDSSSSQQTTNSSGKASSGTQDKKLKKSGSVLRSQISPIDKDDADGISKPAMKRTISSRFFNVERKLSLFVQLPPLKDAEEEEIPRLLARKLDICCVFFDFLEDTYMSEKEMKRQTLLEISEFLATDYSSLTVSSLGAILLMLQRNIFRPLPCIDTDANARPPWDNDDNDSILEAGWSHMELVYVVLMRFLEHTPPTNANAKRFFTRQFISQFIDLFDTTDPRERDFLKNILHSVYGSYLVHRGFIRKSIRHAFLSFTYESERHRGIAELLEILESIINGFALPLKSEHVSFLYKVLLPLHKPRILKQYHAQLSACIVRYCEKDVSLNEPVISYLCSIYPISSSSKELLLLSEMEEILSVCDYLAFKRVVPALFTQLGKTIASENFQVADRSLAFWNNEFLLNLMSAERDVIFPLIMGPLIRNIRFHWNRSIRSLSQDVLRFSAQIDACLFEECAEIVLMEEEERHRDYKDRLAKWDKLEQMARDKLPSNASLPHQSSEFPTPPQVLTSKDVWDIIKENRNQLGDLESE